MSHREQLRVYCKAPRYGLKRDPPFETEPLSMRISKSPYGDRLENVVIVDYRHVKKPRNMTIIGSARGPTQRGTGKRKRVITTSTHIILHPAIDFPGRGKRTVEEARVSGYVHEGDWVYWFTDLFDPRVSPELLGNYFKYLAETIERKGARGSYVSMSAGKFRDPREEETIALVSKRHAKDSDCLREMDPIFVGEEIVFTPQDVEELKAGRYPDRIAKVLQK